MNIILSWELLLFERTPCKIIILKIYLITSYEPNFNVPSLSYQILIWSVPCRSRMSINVAECHFNHTNTHARTHTRIHTYPPTSIAHSHTHTQRIQNELPNILHGCPFILLVLSINIPLILFAVHTSLCLYLSCLLLSFFLLIWH